MFKKYFVLLAFSPLTSIAQSDGISDSNPAIAKRTISSPSVITGLIQQSDGVKMGSGFISDDKNKTIVIGNSARTKDLSNKHPNYNNKDKQPMPPVAKSHSDIAIGNSAYTDSDNLGSPAMAIGNSAVALGGGTVSLGSSATSNGMGGIAIGNKAIQNNGGISIGKGSNSGSGGQIGPFEANRNIAIGIDTIVEDGVSDSIALGSFSSAVKTTGDARFLNKSDAAAQHVGELSIGNGNDVIRRITNVSGGSKDTDAANIAQLNIVNNAATAAQEVAKAADDKATAADGKATTAQEVAKAADDKATAADGKATTAQEAAKAADGKATAAQSTAVTANTTAQKANNTANKAYNLATHNSARIDKLEQRYDDMNDKMKRGFAMSAATANLFQPYNIDKLNITAAIGGYNSEHAIAVGSGYRFNENTAAKASLATSTSSGGAVMYGVGINIEW